jgi:hypothetical protein
MNLYIDCEFNGFGGQLISMALVAEDGNEFYEVLECYNPVPWVAENVMPFLNRDSVSSTMFKKRLAHFLNQYDELHIIADWPDDIKHFCQSLITGPGTMFSTPPRITMEINRKINGISRIPHNALEDARANAEYMMGAKYQ